MNTPEVKFELPTLESEAETLFIFCSRKNISGLNWGEIIYKQHPRLKEMLFGVEDKDKFHRVCYEYAKAYLDENMVILEKAKEDFIKSWKETEVLFFENLSSDFETVFSGKIKEIKANVSINPICPRHLDKWSFNVFYKSPINYMKETCIHEIIHFLYFKKWLEVFPNYDKKTFQNPHSEWRLSEILAPSIMNNNETIQNIIKNNKSSDVYRDWQEIKIDNKKLVDYFGDIYKEHEEGKISFEDFLKKSWSEYKKHKNIIENNIFRYQSKS